MLAHLHPKNHFSQKTRKTTKKQQKIKKNAKKLPKTTKKHRFYHF